jgi:hypothetical protein
MMLDRRFCGRATQLGRPDRYIHRVYWSDRSLIKPTSSTSRRRSGGDRVFGPDFWGSVAVGPASSGKLNISGAYSVAIKGPALAMRTANLARARQKLGDNLYEQARAEGVAMSQQDALAFALRHL